MHQELKRFLSEHPGTVFIDALFVDLCGVVRCKRYPRREAEKIFSGGVHMCHSVYLLDARGENAKPALGRLGLERKNSVKVKRSSRLAAKGNYSNYRLSWEFLTQLLTKNPSLITQKLSGKILFYCFEAAAWLMACAGGRGV